MLVIHNAVYAASLVVLQRHDQVLIDIATKLTGFTLSRDFLDINLSTVFGAIVAMIWNYNGYRLFVFKNSERSIIDE